MPGQIKDSEADKEFLTQMAQFAARKAVNGVALWQLHSKSLSAPVCICIALGEQALALNAAIMKAVAPNEQALIRRASEITGDGF